MFRSVSSAFAVALLLAGPVMAEDKPAQLDSHLSAAVDVVEAMNAKRNFMAIMDAMTTLMVAQVKQSHPTATEKSLEAFRTAFTEDIGNETDELLKMQAAVYAEHFNEADLKALAAFYRSDVGKRFIDEQPAIIKEMSPLATKWGIAAGQRAAQRALEKLQKEGITL